MLRRNDGAAIHMKYIELGGCGIIIGRPSKPLLKKEKEIRRKLKEWIDEEIPKDQYDRLEAVLDDVACGEIDVKTAIDDVYELFNEE